MNNHYKDPTLELTSTLLTLEILKKKVHENSVRRERENAEKAAADKTRSYKIIEYNGVQYIRKFINDSLKNAESWNDRLQLYNKLYVDYLERKSYKLKMWHNSEYYTLTLKQYKMIVRHEQTLHKEETL